MARGTIIIIWWIATCMRINEGEYEVSESDMIVLLVCVCAAKKTTSRGCGIHGNTELRTHGELKNGRSTKYREVF